MDHLAALVVPIALVAWLVYRRIRRTIGFQHYSKRRLLVRTIILAVIGALVLALGVFHPIAFAGDAGGIAAGALLAYAAARYLAFENRDGEWYYRTHVWVETIVLVLFLGRFAYRIINSVATGGQAAGGNSLARMEDPITSGALLMFVCYYVLFAAVLIRKEKELSADAA